jgi:stearoyl-CoA desaturase (Delta-9 desaturase)
MSTPPLQLIPKPDRVRQQFYEGTKRVAFTRNIFAREKSTEVTREKNLTDKIYIAFIVSMHLLCFALPFTFSWSNVALFGVTYFITGCLGITLSYHRQLSHKSFRTPRWLEYVFAYFGALAVQGDPKEWVSTHRYAPCH